MWRMLAGAALVLGSAEAQGWQDLLLPETKHITIVVSDENGAPVAGASVDHSNNRRWLNPTDAQGRFETDTRAPMLVIRKDGFRSEVVWTKNATEFKVTLQMREKKPFRICTTTGRMVGIDGWGASFRFPQISGVKASRQGRDIDYGARSYYIDTKKEGPRGIQHGSGPSWSFGTPIDLQVWNSEMYQETNYDSEGIPIIDARGESSDGKFWRYLGKFGESASYDDADAAAAKILDQVLDGACLASDPQ